jgi:hypothetical protein
MVKDTKVTHAQIKTAAGTDITVYVPAPAVDGEWHLAAVNNMPGATSAANATNYATVALAQGTTAIATSLTTASTAFTAGSERNFTLLTTAAAITARKFGGSTDYVKVTVTAAGAGVAIDLMMSFEWQQLS